MTLVRIVANYEFPLSRFLKPGGWDGIEFTTAPVQSCDYLISLNYPPSSFEVTCPPEHRWAIIQEPSSPAHCWLHTSHPSFARLYSCDGSLRGAHRARSYPALGWHVGRSWQWLSDCQPTLKDRLLSTVTSDLCWMDGHRRRLEFLRSLERELDFDWWGRGVRELQDKWDGLAPYRYSLTFENCAIEDYWTEKLADCFLAWTVPLYWGCPNIVDYFPAEAMVRLDLSDGRRARTSILRALEKEPDERTLEAVTKARELVLSHYSPLAFIAREIRGHQASGCSCKGHLGHVLSRAYPQSRSGKARYLAKHWLESLLGAPVNL